MGMLGAFRYLGLVLLAGMMSVATPATAEWRRVQGGLRLDGPLDKVHHGAFQHFLWTALLSEDRGQPIGIWLNSAGGSLEEALQVVEVIQELQGAGTRVATLVAQNGECDLPCVLVFALGQERYVEDGARFILDLDRLLAEEPDVLQGPLVSILAGADAQFAATVLSAQERQALTGTELAANYPEFTRRLR